MLNAIRSWYVGKPQQAVTEPQPICFVAAADDVLRERISGLVAELGPRVEKFSDLMLMHDASRQVQPDLVYLDTGFGRDAAEAVTRFSRLDKPPMVALMSAAKTRTYDELCAIGHATLALDRAGLRALPRLQPPFSADALKRDMQNAGIRCAAAKTAVTLEQALKQNWLELFYQPKIHLASKRLVGAEGLIRVRHPELGVLPPAAFLPGAREDDMMKMTEQVIVTALSDYNDLAVDGVAMKLSVNTPVSALTTLPIAQMLREERPKAANWPGLILEVTEDEIVNDLTLANNVADELRAHQCSLAIDDFGAGYSSLSRLRQLPFSELKIDRSYVTNCHSDRTSSGMCETIVELAHRFGLSTVAEGIETAHESHKLQGIGCDIGQGYLFAKPMSKPDLVATLRRRLVARG